MFKAWKLALKLALSGVAIIVGTGFIMILVLATWINQSVTHDARSSESRVAVAPRGGIPMDTAIADCNQVASTQAESHREAATAAGRGSLYGLDASKKHDEVYRAAYSRCMADRGYRG